MKLIAFGDVEVGQLVRDRKRGWVYRKLEDSHKGAGRAEFVVADDPQLTGKTCSFNRRTLVLLVEAEDVPAKRGRGRPPVYDKTFLSRTKSNPRIKNPVEYCWKVFTAFEAERPGNYTRADVMKVLGDAGIAFNTARSQWSTWKQVMRKARRAEQD